MRRSLVLSIVAMLILSGCSSSRDLESADETKTTIRQLNVDLADDGLIGGSESAKEVQKLIDKLLATNDACAILTQKDIKGFQIDATALASTSARKVLTTGVIDVYDHIIRLVTDATITPALQLQRDTFVKVLDIVDRYAASPTSKQGNDQIQALMSGEDFVQAQSELSAWTFRNCS